MSEVLVIGNSSLQENNVSLALACDGDDPLSYTDGTSKINPGLHNSQQKLKLSYWPERFILASLCTIVAIGYFTPVIVYFTGSGSPTGSLSQVDFNFDNCSSVTMKVRIVARNCVLM